MVARATMVLGYGLQIGKEARRGRNERVRVRHRVGEGLVGAGGSRDGRQVAILGCGRLNGDHPASDEQR